MKAHRLGDTELKLCTLSLDTNTNTANARNWRKANDFKSFRAENLRLSFAIILNSKSSSPLEFRCNDRDKGKDISVTIWTSGVQGERDCNTQCIINQLRREFNHSEFEIWFDYSLIAIPMQHSTRISTIIPIRYRYTRKSRTVTTETLCLVIWNAKCKYLRDNLRGDRGEKRKNRLDIVIIISSRPVTRTHKTPSPQRLNRPLANKQRLSSLFEKIVKSEKYIIGYTNGHKIEISTRKNRTESTHGRQCAVKSPQTALKASSYHIRRVSIAVAGEELQARPCVIIGNNGSGTCWYTVNQVPPSCWKSCETLSKQYTPCESHRLRCYSAESVYYRQKGSAPCAGAAQSPGP
ncbi:hypothetical protein APICC_05829 [Apis cerana cerana]|uniref:Uncharacterized protein n=1 Tax=Apis cerana cerana TaxID=94128 RepID=A0A2A3EU52_APICC|nr:hypothetical protein APICC_05829 [Apis cerana cerana]